jgi:hypothetical protein
MTPRVKDKFFFKLKFSKEKNLSPIFGLPLLKNILQPILGFDTYIFPLAACQLVFLGSHAIIIRVTP